MKYTCNEYKKYRKVKKAFYFQSTLLLASILFMMVGLTFAVLVFPICFSITSFGLSIISFSYLLYVIHKNGAYVRRMIV